MLQHAASKLAYIALSSARSCRSSICQGRFSTAWLVSLVLWSQRGDMRCSLVVLEAVDVPFPRPFHLCLTLLIIYIYIYICLCRSLSSLPDPDVGLSVLVYKVDDTYIHFGPWDLKFVLCLGGECPGVCTMSKLATHMSYLYTCVFRQIAMLLLKIHRILVLAYAVQLAIILRCIYLSWLLWVKL